MEIRDLPSALDRVAGPLPRLAGQRPAVFLDYDGTLTPIVDRPEDARIAGGMQSAIRLLAGRCPVCVVSGRDRPVVQELMGMSDLIVAGSHGFDIWSPSGTIGLDEGARYRDLITTVASQLRPRVAAIPGAHLELKSASVALHYRLVAEAERPAITDMVDAMLAAHAPALKVTPGKMVYEIQPNIEWDKGRAVLHLLTALNLEADDVTPIYIGDDATDEHAFAALAGSGIGILVAGTDDPGLKGGTTAAGYGLVDVDAVEQFLVTLAGKIVAGRVVDGQ